MTAELDAEIARVITAGKEYPAFIKRTKMRKIPAQADRSINSLNEMLRAAKAAKCSGDPEKQKLAIEMLRKVHG